MTTQNAPRPGKIRHCWNCGANMGFIENRYYDRMDTCGSPECSRAERDAELVSATRRSQGLALASAADDCREAFEAADDLLRALKRFQALPTNRKQEMRDWLADTAGRALDQLGNVQGAIDKELDEQGLYPTEPLDLSELTAFWEGVK